MKIVHLTKHQLFLGGGERLIYSWLRHSRNESMCYSRAGGISYGNDARMFTYGDDAELGGIIERHRNDLLVLHDTMIVSHPALAGMRCLLYVHGAFAFDIDVTHWPAHLALSNYPPKAMHPSWYRIPVIPVRLGVDPSQFCVPKSVKRGPRLRAAIVGRISDEKIPLYFFDFIAKFNREVGGVDFRFYGKGMPSPYLSDFMGRLSRTSNCEFMGELAIDDVQAAYHDNDVLVVPSLSETGSYAIVEAQMCGLRVLALDADGIPHHIRGGSTACRDYDHIFAALVGLKRDTISDRRHQHAATAMHHDITSWAAKLDSVADLAYALR